MLKPGEQLRSPEGEVASATPGAAGGVDCAVLDAAALASLRELDPTGKNQLLKRVFGAFQASTSRLMPQLIDAQRNGDTAGVRHVAHTLKSSSASVGGKALSTLCADIEARIRHGDVAELGGQVESLRKEVEMLLRALEQLSECRP